MKRKISMFVFIILMAMLINSSGTAAQEESLVSPISELAIPMGTAFTYQGQLQDGSGPVNSLCDFEFKMFTSSDGSVEIWGAIHRDNVLVEDGYFTVDDMNFGSETFQGEARFLEIGVRCPSGGGSYEKLSPRQELTAVPYALYASNAGNAWQLNGNDDTSPGLNFLGTNDNVALELHVNGRRALRLEPATSPNVLGGYSGNYVTTDVIGAFIGGGGDNNLPNRVTDQWGTVAGGLNNQAGDGTGLLESAEFATVGGGRDNLAKSLGSTIGGGEDNIADNSYVAIGGGYGNLVAGIYGTIAGGADNKITFGEDNTIGGGGSVMDPKNWTVC